jgi:orotidine-5'-phosphate decarboxylase
MTNVHASGGTRMMTKAREAVENHGGDMLLIAVTVLTSMDDSDLQQVGVNSVAGDQVLALANSNQAGRARWCSLFRSGGNSP